jgi:hypothetical protein
MLLAQPDEIGWDVWIDALNERVSSIELFAQDGEKVLTALIPTASPRTYSLDVVGGTLSGSRADVVDIEG